MPSLKIPKRNFFGWIAMIAFISLAVYYYFQFASNQAPSSNGIFQLAVNQHDHDVYLLNMDLVREGNSLFELANDKGIASIYVFLSRALPFLVTPDMALISFVFNIAILLLSYWIYGKISDALNLGLIGRLSFFVNLSLLYFAQLINKDMATIFIFLFCAYAGMRGLHWYLLLLIPFAAFIRIQLVIFILIFIFIASAKKISSRFWVVYIFTSLLAAYLSVYFSIIGEDSLGDGFSAYLVNLNKEHLIGYLLFNPIRVLQFIFDAYVSFDIFTESGAIDVAKFLRLPQLLLLAALAPHFYTLYTRWSSYSKSIARPLVIVILAYTCTWLMNPTVNARYVMLVTPILVLLGLFVRSTRRHA